MLLLILALAAAPASSPGTQEPAARTLSPVIVSPAAKPGQADATVEMDDETAAGEFVAVWPAAAYNTRADGKVMLSCKINIHGLAEWCGIKTESPAGKGFGAAALQMRPTFKLKPAMGADGPMEAMMTIAVKFKAPDPQFDSGTNFLANRMPMNAVTMLSRPVWAEAPSFSDLAAAYPAQGGNQEGYVVAHCQVLSSGLLKNCQMVKEFPAKKGFAHAAMGIVHKFKVTTELATAPHSTPIWVDIPIRMPPPAETQGHPVISPNWLTGVDPRSAPGVFPPEAVAKGLTTGRGVANCIVAADGSMSACTPDAGDPDGLGFSEAVAKLALLLKVNRWSADAGPVDGGQVRVAIRINLKTGR
jgi:TonB family protein